MFTLLWNVSTFLLKLVRMNKQRIEYGMVIKIGKVHTSRNFKDIRTPALFLDTPSKFYSYRLAGFLKI